MRISSNRVLEVKFTTFRKNIGWGQLKINL